MMWMFAFLLLPLGGLAYLSWHVWCVLPFSALLKTVLIVLMIASFLLLFLNVTRFIDRLPMTLASVVYAIGCSSIFVMLYGVMLFLVLDVGRLMRVVPRSWLYHNGTSALLIVAVLAGVFVYGHVHYKHKYRQVLQLSSAKPLSRPWRVVMMSDLHLGYHNHRSELHRWVDMVNAEQPDMVLIAGDIIDMSMRPLREEQMAEEFRRLSAPVYACLGNHEYYSGEPEAQQFFGDAGIHLLRDTAVVAGDLCIVGRDDRTNLHRRTMAEVMRTADQSKYVVLLDHQPYSLEQAERQHVDFQFSGHTHHGQVWPVSWITEAIYECAFGAHQRGDTRYYVSSGIGIWGGTFRIGTRSEYVVAEIR